MTIRKSAIEPLEENHLCPLITYSVAVAHGARAQLRRVRAGRLRLGHRERAAQVAGEQGLAASAPSARACRPSRGSPSCPSRAPGIAERERRDTASVPRISCISPSLHLAEALAAELGRQVRGPQAACLHLLLQRAQIASSSRSDAELVARSSRSARSPRARARSSSRAAPGSRAPWRSPSSSCCSLPRRAVRVRCGGTTKATRKGAVGRRDQSQATTPPGDNARAREGAASSVTQGDRTREVTLEAPTSHSKKSLSRVKVGYCLHIK